MTPPGIDPGTVGLEAQRLNHYATPGPNTVCVCVFVYVCVYIYIYIYFNCPDSLDMNGSTSTRKVLGSILDMGAVPGFQIHMTLKQSQVPLLRLSFL